MALWTGARRGRAKLIILLTRAFFSSLMLVIRVEAPQRRARDATVVMATAIGENIVVIDHDDDFIRAGYANPEYGPGVLAPASVRLASDATSDAIPPTRVIVDRAVTDWDALEAIYRHIFYKQCGWIEGEEGAALITEPLFTSKADRERLTQLMFESFNVAGLYIAEQPVAALYGVGKTSGVSVDVGFSTTDIAPVVDGVVVTAAATRCALGTVTTRDATRSLLGDAGAALSDDDVDAVRDATCHVSRSRDDALDASDSKTHVLPDGNVVTVDGAARRACVESLFAPDADKGGVSEASLRSGAFYTLVPIRPLSRGERRFLRTFAGASLRPPLAFNPRPRRLSTPTDAFQLHPDIRSYGTTLSRRVHAGPAQERVGRDIHARGVGRGGGREEWGRVGEEDNVRSARSDAADGAAGGGGRARVRARADGAVRVVVRRGDLSEGGVPAEPVRHEGGLPGERADGGA